MSIEKKNTYRKLYEVGGEKVIHFRELVRIINDKLGNNPKLIISIPKQFIRIVAYFFERMFKTPPFTQEHVNALGEHTNMDTSMLEKDLNYHPISLEKMLDIIIQEIKKDPPKLI